MWKAIHGRIIQFILVQFCVGGWRVAEGVDFMVYDLHDIFRSGPGWERSVKGKSFYIVFHDFFYFNVMPCHASRQSDFGLKTLIDISAFFKFCVAEIIQHLQLGFESSSFKKKSPAKHSENWTRKQHQPMHIFAQTWERKVINESAVSRKPQWPFRFDGRQWKQNSTLNYNLIAIPTLMHEEKGK